LIERTDQLALEVVLADLSSADNTGKHFIKVLSSLCSHLKSALTCLERGKNPDEFINLLENEKKLTYFDSNPGEFPGFLNSAKALLEDARQSLSILTKTPDDKAAIDIIFRAFHSLKGEANLTGLSRIGVLANEAEDLCHPLRAGSIKIDEGMITVLLTKIDQLLGSLEAMSPNPIKDLRSQPPVLDLSNGLDHYSDFVTEAFDHLIKAEKSVLVLESAPQDSEAINNIFRAFHSIKGSARFLGLKDIETYAHEAETMLELVRKGTLPFEGKIVDLSLSSIDGIRKLLVLLQEQAGHGGQFNGVYPDIRPLIMELKEVISPKKNQPIGEILIKQGVITDQELNQALKLQKSSPELQRLAGPVRASIRIQLEKLDALLDLVGELVISQVQLIQSPEIVAITHQQFQRNLLELDRNTRNLQELVMGMRLVPIGPVFQKMERVLRDLSKTIGKDVTIVLNGEDTEIDKNMAELITDPLMHMVRNSLDHGIETAQERIAKGKPAIGKVELSASHKGGFVVIEIKDDGRGLDKVKILKKAIERGIVKEGEVFSDNKIYNLIFEAGFTTVENVTDTSGRGVGMDVVRKNIDWLHGKINISSVDGQGTIFCLYIPITLAIVDGIVVRSGIERYVLPIHSVLEFVQPQEACRSQVYDKEQMYKVYDKVYPLIYLNNVFGIQGGKEKFEDQTICFIDSDYGKACVVVDELLGQQHVVIKSVGDKLRNVQGISGAAILGDGRVGLILDAEGLIEFAGTR